MYYARAVGRVDRYVLALVLVRGLLGPTPDARADRPDDLVDVAPAIPDAVMDLRYATANNITGEVLYPAAVCKLRRAVVERLATAAALLKARHRRLLVWDCYRPLAIQQVLWDRVHDTRYVANPKTGSRHNRGAAIDLALVDEDGKPVTLPTEFDDFTAAAHRKRALKGATGAEARTLAAAMAKAGFTGLATEWWHFDAPGGAHYALADEPLQ